MLAALSEKAFEQIGAKTIKKSGEVHEDRLHHVISTPGFGHHPDAQPNQVGDVTFWFQLPPGNILNNSADRDLEQLDVAT